MISTLVFKTFLWEKIGIQKDFYVALPGKIVMAGILKKKRLFSWTFFKI